MWSAGVLGVLKPQLQESMQGKFRSSYKQLSHLEKLKVSEDLQVIFYPKRIDDFEDKCHLSVKE